MWQEVVSYRGVAGAYHWMTSADLGVHTLKLLGTKVDHNPMIACR
jgi:hypothetical protein